MPTASTRETDQASEVTRKLMLLPDADRAAIEAVIERLFVASKGCRSGR